MRIDTLRLQNFACFETCEFSLQPSFNLLVGVNASGKTSVLDALAIAAGSWFLGLRSPAKPSTISLGYVRVLPRRYGDSYFFEKRFPCEIAAAGKVMETNVSWSRCLERNGGHTTSAGARAISDIGARAGELLAESGEVDLPVICVYGTERLWFESEHRPPRKRDAVQPTRPSRLDGYRFCLKFQIQESFLLQWIQDESLAGFELRSVPIGLRVVKEAIRNCVDGAEDLYFDPRIKDLVLVLRGNEHQLFQNLSDGQRMMVTLIGDLARRAVTLNPHLGLDVLSKVKGLVTIDELDLHLHPKWQRRVIRDLKSTFPLIQFVATTHSPQLIGEASANEITVLSNNHPISVSQSYGMDSNWILNHIMESDERDSDVKSKLSEVEELINKRQLLGASKELTKLRAQLGNHPDFVRYAARIDRFSRASK